MAKNGKDNLIKAEDLTSEQLRERAVNGGIASGKARAAKKSMKELALVILNSGLTGKEKALAEKMESLGIVADTQKGLAYLLCLKKAMKKGKARDLVKLLEVAGEHDPAPVFGTPEINLRPVVNVLMPGEKPPEEDTAGDTEPEDSKDSKDSA